MNNTLMLSAVFIIAACVSIILINFLINLFFSKKLEFEDSKKSLTLFKAGNIISFFLVFITVKVPFEHFMDNTKSMNLGKDIMSKSISYFVLFLFICYVFHLMNILITNFLFKIISNGKNFIESIKENHTENIIVFISISICLCLVIQNHIPDIFDLLIPYPKTPIFR
jgi:hypothetical protein